jgi:hypothetical protein
MKPIDYTKRPVWLIRGAGGGGGSGGSNNTTVQPYEGSISRPIGEKVGEFPSVLDWGADRTGGTDSAPKFQDAIDAVAAAGGGTLFIPKGDYILGAPINMAEGVTLRGEGPESKLFRSSDLPDGQGLINISANHVGLADFEIDGQVTVTQRLLYADFGSDPMHTLLTKNTSVWVHGGDHIHISGCTIEHSGGYGILLDATGAMIRHVILERNLFENNRPHLFGLAAGDIEYGSWTGGIHYQGDGTTNAVEDVLFFSNTFRRCTGNCIWGHLYHFDKMHKNLRHVGNHFEDFGLDGILVGGVVGGVVDGNTFRRGGYIAYDDASLSVPRYLGGATPKFAVGLDTSGLVQGVNYANNTFISMNGACMDLDGFSNGAVTGNYGWMPEPGTREYSEDRLSTAGPGGTGDNWCYGVQVASTYGGTDGACRISVTGNMFRNLGGGAILLCCRDAHVAANNIDHGLGAWNRAPIWLFNRGAERCCDNVIESNQIRWNPSSPQAAVLEVNLGSAWVKGEANHVRNNRCIGANCYEFERDPSTDSTADLVVSSREPGLASKSESIIRRDLPGGTGALRFLYGDRIVAGLLDGGLLNVSVDGAPGTGAITTGPRTQVGFYDVVATGKISFDAFLAARAKESGTFLDAEADILDDTWALLRFNRTASVWEQSIQTSASKRVWTVFSGGGGGGTPGGGDGMVQFNLAGAFAGSPNLTWDNTNQVLRLTGKAPVINPPAPPQTFYGIVLPQGAVNAADGFYTPSQQTNAIQAPAGGINGRWLIATDSIFAIGRPDAPAAPDSGQGKFYYNAPGKQFEYWDETAQQWLPFGKSSGGTISGLTPPGIAYASSGTSLATSASFTWLKDDLRMVIASNVGQAAIDVTSGYVQAEGGFATASPSTNAIKATAGGIIGKWLAATESITVGGLDTAPAGPDAGQGRIYYNKSESAKRFEVWDEAASVWRPLSGITGSAQTNAVAYGTGPSSIGFEAVFNYTPASHTLGIGNITASGTIGTASDSTSAISAAAGGIVGKYLGAGESLTITGVTPAPGGPDAGQGRIYFNPTSNLFLYWDHVTHGWKPFGSGGGGVPGGGHTQVQVNDNGAFAGYSGFTYNQSQTVLTAPTLYLTSTAERSFNAEGTGIIDAMEMRTDSVEPATITAGKYGAREIRFRLDSTVPAEVSSGSIVYKSGYCPDGLGIVGGTLSPNRKIYMWDLVEFPVVPTAGINITAAGSIRADGGFSTKNKSYQAIQAYNDGTGQGGVYARSGHFETYTDIGTSAGEPGMTTGAALRSGIIYWDSTLSAIRVRTPSGWQSLGIATAGATPGGGNYSVQVNVNGTFGGYTDFQYNDSIRQLAVLHPDGNQIGSNTRSSAWDIYTGTAGSWRGLSIHHTNRNSSAVDVYEYFNDTWNQCLLIDTSGNTLVRGLATSIDNIVGESQGNTSYGYYTSRAIHFRLNPGDDGNASSIINRPSWSPDSLSIIGANSGGSGRRLVRLWDRLDLQSTIDNWSLVASGPVLGYGGFYTTHTSYQAIQAPSGGVYARSLHALYYTDIGSNAGPPQPPNLTAGAALRAGVIYWDTSNSSLQVYTPSGWQRIGTGGGGNATGPENAVQRNRGGVFYGDGELSFTGGQLYIGPQGGEGGELVLGKGSGQNQAVILDCVGSGDGYFRMYGSNPPYYVRLNITGQPNTWSLKIDNGYVDSAMGYTTAHNEWNVIQAVNGGIYARSLICVSYVGLGVNFFNPANSSGAPIQTGSKGIQFGSIFYSNYDHEIYFLKGPQGAGLWTRLSSQGGGSGGGSAFTTQISTTHNSYPGTAAIVASSGYVWAKGFNASGLGLSGNYDSIQTDGGMKSNLGYWVGNTQVMNASGAFVGPGVDCPNNGVGAKGFNVYEPGVGWRYGYNYDVPAGRGLMVRGGVIISYY